MSKFWNWVERNFYSKESNNITERSVIECILNAPKFRISAKELAEYLGVFTKHAKQKLSFLKMKGVLNNNTFLDNFWENNYVINKKMLPKLSEKYPDLAHYFQKIDKHTHSFLGNLKDHDLAGIGERLGDKIKTLLGVPENKNPNNQRQQIDKPVFNRPTNTLIPSDSQIIQWALENQGVITATLLCVKANIPIENAREILEKLHIKQVFDMEVNDKGVIVYKLQEM